MPTKDTATPVQASKMEINWCITDPSRPWQNQGIVLNRVHDWHRQVVEKLEGGGVRIVRKATKEEMKDARYGATVTE